MSETRLELLIPVFLTPDSLIAISVNLPWDLILSRGEKRGERQRETETERQRDRKLGAEYGETTKPNFYFQSCG